jgi:hypothetical protein
MSNFEEVACKVLGFILFCIVCLLVLQLNGCAPKIKEVPIARVPTKITSFPLEDHKGELHKYRDNFDSFIFPRDSKKLTQYCAFHFEWEDIKAVYGKDEHGEWGYSYIISKNKKSWK